MLPLVLPLVLRLVLSFKFGQPERMRVFVGWWAGGRSLARDDLLCLIYQNFNFSHEIFLSRGEFTMVRGPSGGGKTTFLNIIGTIDIATKGIVSKAFVAYQ